MLAPTQSRIAAPLARTPAHVLLVLLLLITASLADRASIPTLNIPILSTNPSIMSPPHHQLRGPTATFDAASGLLLMVGDAQANQVHVAMTSTGYMEVTVDHRRMSSDPGSPAYAAALAGLTPATVTRIWLDASAGAATLVLDSQHYPASLQIGTDGSLLIAGSVTARGQLTISAHTLRVEGSVSGSVITLSSTGLLDIPVGATVAARDGADGGQIHLTGHAIVVGGVVRADGASGGQVDLEAASLLHAGTITANRTAGAAGQVQVRFTTNYVDTARALIAASGGYVRLDGEGTGHLFSSGRHDVSSAAPGTKGGDVLLLGKEIVLVGTQIDASGDAGGGSVLIGGAGLADRTTLPTARSTYLAPATTVTVAARRSGDGGRLVVWADEQASVGATLLARAGWANGNGGQIEVSAREHLAYAGMADASAQAGRDGTLLIDPKNITISSASGVLPQYNLINPTPNASDTFGATILPLSGGNIVVTDQGDDTIANNAGAVYLFNGSTGALLSALTGSTANDQIGNFGVVALTNGNYVVRSPNWDNGATADVGAATWGSGATGTSGTISAANSLIGSTANDQISSFGVVALSNGNYIVRSTNWDNGAIANVGAATWGNGTTGAVGTVSAANSLIGSTTDDRVGFGSVMALSNGNYVVRSPNWDNGATTDVGAATWGNGATGTVGTVSAANSLIGSTANDQVGSEGVALTNGNYVVASPNWDNAATVDAGAATWGNGTSGTSGTISAANSLVGSTASDQVGNFGVIALSNGNYVVRSPNWDNGATVNVGAATWGSGTGGTVGTISAANSLIGSTAGDQVGSIVTALTNGNYVAVSQNWDSGATQNVGAVTWGNGASGTIGTISAANSLIGSTAGDQVGFSGLVPLTNGNYVAVSPNWDNGATVDVGAATWGSGTGGTVGTISAANSLIGSTTGDQVGSTGVVALTNGNYVVASPNWDNGATADVGAATWGSGTTGTVGTISAANSLIGSSAGDQISLFGVVALTNGNYVVRSPFWDNGVSANVGAATWGSGTGGTVGTVSAANSLIGATANDQVGSFGIAALTNGSYIVRSQNWDNGATQDAGAVTYVGSDGKTLDGIGTITSQNSIIGQIASAGLSSSTPQPVSQTFLAQFANENGGRITAGFTDPNLLTFDRGQSQTISITPAFLKRTLDTGTAVVLQASNDITIDSALTVDNASGSGGALTLQAGRSILINANITTDNGALTLIANDQIGSGVVDAQRDAGAATVTMANGTSVDTGSEALAIELRDGAGKTNTTSGAISLGAITARSLAITHNGPTAGSGIDSSAGLVVSGPTILTASSGHDIILTQPSNDFNSMAITAANNVAILDSNNLTLNTTIVTGTLAVTATTSLTGLQPLTARNSVRLTAGTSLAWNAALAVGSQTVTLGAAGAADLGSSTTLAGGILNAANGVRLTSGDSLSGVGTVNGAVTIQSGGTLSPGGSGVGTLTVNGNLTAASGATVAFDLNGSAGGLADQLAVNGTIDLGTSTLLGTLGFSPAVGDQFVIIANDGSDAVIGTFNGLAEGATLALANHTLQISYMGGDGNDVVLRASAQQVNVNVYLPLMRR